MRNRAQVSRKLRAASSQSYSVNPVNDLLDYESKGAGMPPSNHIDLIVIVNGQPTPIHANVNEPLHALVAQALAATGNVGQPPENWELRKDGALLDSSQKLKTFGFAPGTELFLNLKAGV